ncbi:MAG: membrane protein insertase YidC [Actinobacteria bacterium]|nr:membrane protein insertase YidC [Actinomycetota bacterium]
MSLFNLLAKILSGAYSLTGNYGLAIMLFTLAVMLLVTPLTLKGTKSMLAMQKLQPEIKKIQTRYKDDVTKRNEEMMRFYKENNINPVGGCLPLVIQMPIFFVLYRVLIGLTQRAPYGSDMGHAAARALGNRSATFEAFGRFKPSHLDSGKLYDALRGSRTMTSFGVNLADSASQTLSRGVGKALPFLILIGVVAASGWYQQRQLQARTPASAQNPQQQMIMKVMPFFLPVISFGLPAGVVLYFVVSNLYRIGQQGFITRTLYADSSGGAISTKAVDTTAKGAGNALSKKTMRQQIADLKEQAELPQLGRAARGKRSAEREKATSSSSRRSAATRPTGSKARSSVATAASSAGGAVARPTRSSGAGAKIAKPVDADEQPVPSRTPPPRAGAPSRKPPTTGANRSKKKKRS